MSLGFIVAGLLFNLAGLLAALADDDATAGMYVSIGCMFVVLGLVLPA